MGVLETGKRALLDVSIAVSEQEVHWRQFLQSLVERGLSGVELIISRIEGKTKLSQNRTDADISGVVAGLQSVGQRQVAGEVERARPKRGA